MTFAAHSLPHGTLPFQSFFEALPAEAFEASNDPVLVGSSNLVRVKAKGLAGHLAGALHR